MDAGSVLIWYFDMSNPVPTVDIIIEQDGGIVLIERRNPPHGWALPGGSSIMVNPWNLPPAGKPWKKPGWRWSCWDNFIPIPIPVVTPGNIPSPLFLSPEPPERLKQVQMPEKSSFLHKTLSPNSSPLTTLSY
jgi:hypothetical protein